MSKIIVSPLHREPSKIENKGTSEKHNCRNCTACLFETNEASGVITNKIHCYYGLVDIEIGDNTNHFVNCDKYTEYYYTRILGAPITEEEEKL